MTERVAQSCEVHQHGDGSTCFTGEADGVQSQIGLGRTYDARGNIIADARIIAASGASPRTVTYAYTAADLVTQVTYPSGRQVQYTRDTLARITLVQSRKIATDPWSDIATGIVYQPMSRLVQSLFAGNGLSNWNTYTSDYELDLSGVYDGATKLIERTHTRTDKLNLTNIWDNVAAGNNQSFWASPSNRLQNADGPWGSKTYFYDGVGNRTFENTTVAGVTTSDNYTYPATSNRVQSVVRLAATTRSLTYDGAGNIATDTRSGIPYAYTYNNANRLKTVTAQANLTGTYTYNGFEQLIARVVTNSGTANGTTFFVHDLWGNVIAELDATGTTVREYIYLPEAEIAPTRQARTQVDRPIAVISGVNTASPATLFVHVDHLNRPTMMTNAAKASVWAAIWTPWGTPQSITGAETNDARFPGQWFQLEAGLAYNWYRHYDPSLGRYTQPDPLGFVDGPSVYAYAKSKPLQFIDPEGLMGSGHGTSQSFNPNGNTTPEIYPQDEVCTVSGNFGAFLNKDTKIIACCKKHDDCYAENKCNATSWKANLLHPPTKTFDHCPKPPPCAKCNSDVADCIEKVVLNRLGGGTGGSLGRGGR
jgi:RHS repeat-associated protein